MHSIISVMLYVLSVVIYAAVLLTAICLVLSYKEYT